MLSNNHLQLFAQQLASWSEQIIENGRTPFRRVDLFHRLQTSAGACCPPLIFWINRQSMIAGGLLFLPNNGSDTNHVKEAAAAESLGLRNFVTWETEKINIWETATEGNILVNSLPLTQTQDPAAFHHRLYELIDHLKLLSVTGRIDTNEISSFYLLNLLEETLTLSLPALLENCRMQLSGSTSTLTAEEKAQSWNRLALLRLLSLLNWEILPANVPMDQLTASSEKLLALLPEPLGQTLLSLTPEASINLPAESAVAFHHLLLRLQQLDWKSQDNRGEKAILLLLKLWYGNSASEIKTNNNHRLLLHSRELAPNCCREISHSGAQLAANTLARVLDNRTHPLQLQGDTFKLSSSFDETFLHANFYGDLRPDPLLRRELAGHLRNSWPNRRLVIPGSLPFWATEAAHFLGLTSQNCKIELHLPANWLDLLIDSFFTELIFTNFVLETIDCRNEERHLLTLSRRQEEVATECLLPENSCRSLELGLDYKQAASRLLCALELPSQLFDLFTDQQLVLLTETGVEALDPQALVCYSQRSLGKQLWEMRTQAPIPDTAEKLLAEGKKINWLVPEASCLKELYEQLSTKDLSTDDLDLDVRLTQLLGLPTEVPNIKVKITTKESTVTKQVNRNLTDEILRLLEIEGIPHFPQTYLYRQATGPLSNYKFTPPLKLRQELLGQYVLEDAKGQSLMVTGEETKEALLLASILELRSLEIPVDRQQTAEMLDSYRQDLLKLQDTMTRLCLLHVEQSTAAHRLKKKLWQQLPLPPLKWLSS